METQALTTVGQPANAIALPTDLSIGAAEAALAMGDLARLTPNDRLKLYAAQCSSVGLNPLTRPLEYITLDGKLVLYVRSGAADQLGNLHKVSMKGEPRRTMDNGCLIVQVTVSTQDGRETTKEGIVSIVHPDRYYDKKAGQYRDNPKGGQMLTGTDYANARMKAETKAWRRAVLAHVGLGLLDESEMDTVNRERREAGLTEIATAADRASALNAELTDPEPAQPATTTVRVEAYSLPPEPEPEPKAEPTPTATPAPQPVKAPEPVTPPQPDPGRSQSALPSDVIEKLELILAPFFKDAIAWLVANGKLAAGEPWDRMKPDTARLIVQHPEAFEKRVKSWKAQQTQQQAA